MAVTCALVCLQEAAVDLHLRSHVQVVVPVRLVVLVDVQCVLKVSSLEVKVVKVYFSFILELS